METQNYNLENYKTQNTFRQNIKLTYGLIVLVTLLLFGNSSIAQNFTTAPVPNPFGLVTNPGDGIYCPTFIDIDNDGDQDLFLGRSNSGGKMLEFHENTGTASTPDFSSPAIVNPFGIIISSTGSNNFYVYPSFADLDGDNDYDLLIGIGNNTNDFEFYENTGTSSSPIFGAPIVYNIPNGLAPKFIDYEGDGDVDLFVGNNWNLGSTVEVQYQENIGTPTVANFLLVPLTPPVGANDVALHAVGDLNGDSNIDMIVCGNTPNVAYFTSDGSGVFTLQGTLLTGIESYQSPELVDIDNDGDLDLFIGMEAQFHFFENTDPTASVGEYLTTINLNMYPNPTIDILTIESDKSMEQIEVFNVLGKRVSQFENTEQINMSNLKSGIYIVRITFSDGNFAIKRVQKQ